MLFWAMVLLLGDVTIRLLCWSLFIFIPMSVVHAWVVGSDLRWIVTILTVGLGLLLLARWAKFKGIDRARVSWIVVVLLISISVIFDRTDNQHGYSIFNQPTNRLMSVVMAGSVLMTLLTFWRLTNERARYAKAGLVVIAAYGLLAFLPGFLGNVPVRELFAPAGVLVGLPWFLQPAGFAVAILLPLAVIAGIVDSIRSMKHGDPPALLERWFEFSCIILSAVGGLVTLFRVHAPAW